jgi:hypothetical protein
MTFTKYFQKANYKLYLLSCNQISVNKTKKKVIFRITKRRIQYKQKMKFALVFLNFRHHHINHNLNISNLLIEFQCETRPAWAGFKTAEEGRTKIM